MLSRRVAQVADRPGFLAGVLAARRAGQKPTLDAPGAIGAISPVSAPSGVPVC